MEGLAALSSSMTISILIGLPSEYDGREYSSHEVMDNTLGGDIREGASCSAS